MSKRRGGTGRRGGTEMNNTDTGGPELRMTLRQYAAIKLKVPDSGTDWLDDMIRESLHDDFAAKAMQAIVSNGDVDPQKISQASHIIAEAMLKARQA